MRLNLNPNMKKKDPKVMALVIVFAAAACLLTAAFTKNWLANGKYIGFGPLGYKINCGDGWTALDFLGGDGDEDDETICESKSGGNGKFVAAVKKLQDHRDGFRREMEGRRGGRRDPDETVMETSRALSERGPSGEWKASGAFPITGWLTMIASVIAALGLLVAGGLAAKNKRPELKVSPASVAVLAIVAAMVTGCIFVATKPGYVGMVGVSWSFWLFGAGTVGGIAGAQMIAKLIRPVDPDLEGIDPDLLPQ